MQNIALRVSMMQRQRGGFTLIELVALMVIVGILAAVAVPAISSMDSSRQSVVAKVLVHDLTFARQRAISSGTRTWVVFDVGGDSWSVLTEDADSPGRAGATVLTDSGTGRDMRRILDSGEFKDVRIASADFDGDVEIGFDWEGKPLNTGETTLAAKGEIILTGGHVIEVATVTGHARYIKP